MKGDPCFVVAGSAATLSPAATGEVEKVSNELGDLAGDVTSQGVQVVPGFFSLLIRDKMVI